MKKIDKSIIPGTFNTDKSEDGFYAEFYPDGQLAHYGYYIDGNLDDRWSLFLEPEGNGAFARRILISEFTAEESGDSHNGQHAELTAKEEEEFADFVESWVARIHEDAENSTPRCSFCNKSPKEVKRLIAGPSIS